MARQETFGTWLEREYLRRKAKNPKYSLRAFARHIHLPAGRVSEVFHDRRGLSESTIAEVLVRLKVSEQRERDVRSLVAKRKRFQTALKGFGKSTELPSPQVLSDHEFEVIADPIYYAVLALVDGKVSPSAFARKLGVSQSRVDRAVRRLKKIGLLLDAPEGYRLKENWLWTQTDRYSEALRLHHKRKLRHAILAVDRVPLLQRDVTSWTVNIDPEKIPLAKELIRDFQRKMAKLLSAENQSRVYHFNFQMVPFCLGPGEHDETE